MKNNMLSLTLATIGCATGVASLLINFYKALIERSKLDIVFDENLNVYFNRLKNLSSYKTNFQGIIYITFINKSSLPITIYEIETLFNGNVFPHMKYEGKCIELTTNPDSCGSYDSRTYHMEEQIILPLKLEAFSAYKGFMFFPFFPDVTNDTEKIDIIIKSSRKVLNRSCKISNFNNKIQEN